MPVPPSRGTTYPGLRRSLDRLDALPLRPATTRLVVAALGDDASVPAPEWLDSAKPRAVLDVDPGWVLDRSRRVGVRKPLELIEASGWWPLEASPCLEALERLWRHAVAVGQAARRLAREAGLADVDGVAAAGLLHGLGRWAAAAVEPRWLVDWLALADATERREWEFQSLGMEASELGRRLAERWGCDPRLVDATWLHDDLAGGLGASAADPEALRVVQQAFVLAERTPWALFATEPRDLGMSDPRLRLLIAEVQVRCGSAFREADASPHEERLTRSHARLRLRLGGLLDRAAAAEGLVTALGEAEPGESPELWAERAARAWCGAPGIATARVVWTGPGSVPPQADRSPRADRPASRIIRLRSGGTQCAEVHLWTDRDRSSDPLAAEAGMLEAAWQSWASLVAERTRTEQRLQKVVRAHRAMVEQEEPRLRRAKLDALGEFAAGAGHELNNPLAVIVGRAQLLLARTADPDSVRSLRAILAQAQRAHRILRDLMFVARTPEPRPRFCQPEEIVRSSLRDLKTEADTRGVRLALEASSPSARVWADPDALRHLADVLVRNALESTPKGGSVQVVATVEPRAVGLTVRDNGRGIAPAEGEHLFDPFYCGRQAGRGLGLGLPRAARIVQQAGGELRWHSALGQGSIFRVHLPLEPPPKPLALAGDPGTAQPSTPPADAPPRT